MYDGRVRSRRWRMRVDDFALLRGATEPVTSKQTAELVLAPKFLAEIVAGGEPRRRKAAAQVEELTVAVFLDRFYTACVEAEGLKSAITIQGQMKGLKASLGELPGIALQKPAEIARFKADFRKGRTVATVNRALGTLRAVRRSTGGGSRTRRCSR